jgi:hypothetical protein
MLKNLVFLKLAAEKKLAPLTFSTSRGHPAVSKAERFPQSPRYTRSRVSGASTASAWISNTFVPGVELPENDRLDLLNDHLLG